MLAVGSTHLWAVALLLLSSNRDAAQADAQSANDRGVAVAVGDSSSSFLLLGSAQFPRPCRFSPYSPYRTRLKSVLEETDREIVGERDLGPVTPTKRPAACAKLQLVASRLSTVRPMRC
jgi:hypothetical protein